jgi:hypothetical protein
MAVFLLDTDMLGLHQRNQSHVIAAVDSHVMDQLCVSTVTLAQVAQIVANSTSKPDCDGQISRFFRSGIGVMSM